jgi:hypothetical protein
MNRDQELGHVRKGFRMCRDELENSQFEVRRLRALISRAVKDFEESGYLPEVVEWLDNESRQLVQCGCGKLWGHDELVWRPWQDVGLEIAECTICSSTLSRTYCK